ncbi:MAG: hypothetical protein V4674_00970 [Patescibacteria group bacterium]
MEHTPPTLAEVDAYEVPSFLALRISRIYDYPIGYCEGLLREAKRMLSLCIVSGQAVAPSDRVDIAWHEMLMFTRFYKQFAEYIGGFIDHVPNPPPEMGDPGPETWKEIKNSLRPKYGETETYTQTKANYKKFFGEETDPQYWP